MENNFTTYTYMNKAYDDFETVEELMEYFHLDPNKNLITEKLDKKEKKETKEKIDAANEVDDGLDGEKIEVAFNPSKGDEVEYADLKKKPENIFKHIIIFTNSRDPKTNKTLGNILDAVKNLKKAGCEIIPELHIFVSSGVTFEEDEDNLLSVTDGEETFEFTDESNMDTLVFSRLGVQGEDVCEHVVGLLQDRGLLVLNPLRYSELASNKYDTAVLLQKGEIPQPRFCSMDKDVLYDEKMFLESMRKVFPKWSKDSDKNEDFKMVVKILDGHGGTGVFMTDGKKLTAILQAIFAIDKNRQLIIQSKEEGDGGDIRVHVLTLRDRQVILGAMKRVKLGGDFRSNVSLGATAEPVKLTPEQEQIALKTAKLSHLPWCAVDIMPLVKGSNKELGDNVVLEINASPGTDGISEVLGVNFVNVLLNELTHPVEFYLQDKVAGFRETIEIDFGQGPIKMLAKLDTGNGSTASHVEVGKMDIKGDKVKFTFQGKQYEMDVVGTAKSRIGSDRVERITVSVPFIRLGQRCLTNVPFGLVEKRDKSTNALLNRTLLSWLGLVVNPSKTHILTIESEKVKII